MYARLKVGNTAVSIHQVSRSMQPLKRLASTQIGLLQANLHSAFITRRIALCKVGKKVCDVVPRMSIQASPQALLVQIMCNQADTPPQNKQAVKNTHVEVVLCLFRAEGAAIAEEIHEANGNTAVNVKNKVVLLRRSNGLNSDGVVKHLAAREALVDEFFDKFDTEIRVVARLDLMANTRD